MQVRLMSAAVFAAVAGLTGSAWSRPVPTPCFAPIGAEARADQPVIQLAICLDTSGSMQGLLHQARTRIWSIVNELARVRHCGVAPRLEVALYQYGSDQHPSSENFAACVLPFTSDLDAVSEALFAMSIAGSSEFCGAVIHSAVEHLTWTATGEGALRLLVIAGNEPFTQGPIDYRSAVPAAVERGIVINTIYCGRDEEGQATGWLHAAHLAGGDYAVIEQDKVLVNIPCPQDEPLRRLNERLNKTYLHYGAEGRESGIRQESVDRSNAEADADGFYSRIASKSTANYDNAAWDLVDLYTARGAAAVAGVDRTTLPDAVQKLGEEVLLAKVEALAAERASIQAQIQELSAERERFLVAERAARGDDASGALDSALLASIRGQAAAAGFVIAE